MAKIDRKELKEADQFFESVGTANRWISDNQSKVIGLIVAGIAVFAGFVALKSYRETRMENAAAAFLRATGAFASDNLESAEVAMENALNSATGPYGPLAELYLATIKAEKGNTEEAAAAYAAVANSADADYIKQIALVGQGFAKESTGHPAEAIAFYDQAAVISGPHTQNALRAKVRAAVAAGDAEAAQTAVDTLLEKFPDLSDGEALSALVDEIGSAP